jgi:histidinol-phosphate/aromatic aminotransferase/cobyric acid decarboxylase-like protein
VPGPVAVPVPGFNEYENVLRPGQLVPFPLAAPDFALDVDAYARVVRERGGRVAVVVSPNNPTSVAVPAADLRRLCAAVAPALLLLDESFVDFAAPPAGSLLPDLDEHANLVVLKSVSKVYGVGGLRLGFSATADPGLGRWIADRLPIWNVNGLAEEFLRLLPHFRADFEASCVRVRAETRELARLLAALPGAHVVPPDANFVLLRLPPGRVAAEVADALFAARGILTKDCGGKTMPDGDRWLRVASRTEAENAAVAAGLADVLGGTAPLSG